MEENIDTITKVVVGVICITLVGALSTLAAVALFGPNIAPLMKYLPW